MRAHVRSGALMVAACGCAGATVVVAQGCVVAPPADLPIVVLPPRIWHNSVSPPEGILSTWPVDDKFVIPVLLEDPNERSVSVTIKIGSRQSQSFQQLPEGGALTETIEPSSWTPPFDPACERPIEVDVSDTDPGVLGGDHATWVYEGPSGVLPCVFDAGLLEDGGFPSDVVSDVLAVPPESGGGR